MKEMNYADQWILSAHVAAAVKQNRCTLKNEIFNFSKNHLKSLCHKKRQIKIDLIPKQIPL